MATDSIAVSKNAEATSFGQGAVVVLGRLLFAEKKWMEWLESTGARPKHST
jgi:hypothetical protein